MAQKVIPISFRLNKLKNWESSWISEKKDYSKFLHFDLELRKYVETLFTKNLNELYFNKVFIKQNSNTIYIYIYVYSGNYKLNYLLKRKKEEIEKNIQKIFPKELANNFKLSLINTNQLIYKKKRNFKFYKKKRLTYKQKYKLSLFKTKYFSKYFPKNQFPEVYENLNLTKFKFRRYKKRKKKKIFNFQIMKITRILNAAIAVKNAEILSIFLERNLRKQKKHVMYVRRNVITILSKIFEKNKHFIGYRIQLKGRMNGKKRKQKASFQEGPIPLSKIDSDIKYSYKRALTRYGICSIKVWLVFNKKKKDVISK